MLTLIVMMVFFTGLMMLSAGCSESNDTDPSVNFLKIYDDARFNASYLPVDIIQTEDEGFLILSGTRLESTDFVGTKVIKVDRDGNYLNQITFPETIVHPVGDWLSLDGTYYFFAMDATNLSVLLYGVSAGGNVLDPVTVGTTYPLHASLEDGNFLLLSYDNNSKSTIL